MARETLANPVEQEIRETKRTFVSKSEEKRVTAQMAAKAKRDADRANRPASPVVLCAACDEPGAGSEFNGKLYHMTCRMEAKREAGLR